MRDMGPILKEIERLKARIVELEAAVAVTHEALRNVSNPIHQIHWTFVYPGDPTCHCSICRGVREALSSNGSDLLELVRAARMMFTDCKPSECSSCITQDCDMWELGQALSKIGGGE